MQLLYKGMAVCCLIGWNQKTPAGIPQTGIPAVISEKWRLHSPGPWPWFRWVGVVD